MNWTKQSDSLETSGPFRIERRSGIWLGFAPDQPLAIYTSPAATFSSNSEEEDRELARQAVEDYAREGS